LKYLPRIPHALLIFVALGCFDRYNFDYICIQLRQNSMKFKNGSCIQIYEAASV